MGKTTDVSKTVLIYSGNLLYSSRYLNNFKYYYSMDGKLYEMVEDVVSGDYEIYEIGGQDE